MRAKFVNESKYESIANTIQDLYGIKAIDYGSNVLAVPYIYPEESMPRSHDISIQFKSVVDILMVHCGLSGSTELDEIMKSYGFKKNTLNFKTYYDYYNPKNHRDYTQILKRDIKKIIKLLKQMWGAEVQRERDYYADGHYGKRSGVGDF